MLLFVHTSGPHELFNELIMYSPIKSWTNYHFSTVDFYTITNLGGIEYIVTVCEERGILIGSLFTI